VSVWSIKSALQAAFEAGKQAERTEAAMTLKAAKAPGATA
jgi:hypothetical protein